MTQKIDIYFVVLFICFLVFPIKSPVGATKRSHKKLIISGVNVGCAISCTTFAPHLFKHSTSASQNPFSRYVKIGYNIVYPLKV